MAKRRKKKKKRLLGSNWVWKEGTYNGSRFVSGWYEETRRCFWSFRFTLVDYRMQDWEAMGDAKYRSGDKSVHTVSWKLSKGAQHLVYHKPSGMPAIPRYVTETIKDTVRTAVSDAKDRYSKWGATLTQQPPVSSRCDTTELHALLNTSSVRSTTNILDWWPWLYDELHIPGDPKWIFGRDRVERFKATYPDIAEALVGVTTPKFAREVHAHHVSGNALSVDEVRRRGDVILAEARAHIPAGMLTVEEAHNVLADAVGVANAFCIGHLERLAKTGKIEGRKVKTRYGRPWLFDAALINLWADELRCRAAGKQVTVRLRRETYAAAVARRRRLGTPSSAPPDTASWADALTDVDPEAPQQPLPLLPPPCAPDTREDLILEIADRINEYLDAPHGGKVLTDEERGLVFELL